MKRSVKIILALLVILIFSGWLYVRDYYHAQPEALEISQAAVQMGDWTLFCPEEPSGTGLVFYPGGKVEPSAYGPLLEKLSQKGIFCVLLKMPCNLAVLNPNGAKDVPSAFPEITHWYIGGHSLGGSMAAHFAYGHPDAVEGIILLAAYSTDPVEQFPVLSIYGSEDSVLNREKYVKNRANLPESCTELVIDGGNHAFFGTYGPQKGDGTATISPEAQQQEAARAMAAFMLHS